MESLCFCPLIMSKLLKVECMNCCYSEPFFLRQLENCAHVFCFNCLNRHLTLGSDTDRTLPLCPQCYTDIAQSDMDSVLEHDKHISWTPGTTPEQKRLHMEQMCFPISCHGCKKITRKDRRFCVEGCLHTFCTICFQVGFLKGKGKCPGENCLNQIAEEHVRRLQRASRECIKECLGFMELSTAQWELMGVGEFEEKRN